MSGAPREYGYDTLNRLTSAEDVTTGTQNPAPSGLSETYGYDGFGDFWESGNFTFAPTGYNTANQPLPNTSWSYDAAGDLVSDGLGNQYTWNGAGMLASANGVDYSYDAEGNRVGKSGSGATDTVYFGGQPMARLASGAWTDLVYGARGVLAEVDASAGTVTGRMIDRLGSTVGTLSETGTVLATQDYAPFGQLFNGNNLTDPFQFTGKEYDSESGNDYFGARYYTATMGRFLSPDWSAQVEPVPYAKLDNPQSLNLYSYVFNNPMTGVDLDGHQDQGSAEDLSQYASFCTDEIASADFLDCEESWDNATGGWEGWGTFQAEINAVNSNSVPTIPPTTIQVNAQDDSCMNSPSCQFAYRQIVGAGRNLSTMRLLMPVTAPNNGTPWYQNSCITSALGKGALSVGVDSIGLIPEGGAVSALFSGFNGAAGISNGTNILQSVKMGAGIIGTASGASDSSTVSAGLGVLGIAASLGRVTPVVGQVISAVSILNDVYSAGKAIANCQ